MTYTLEALPTTGSLFQLSQVFSSYGYEPKGGSKVAVSNTNVTGSNNRIYYKRPSPDLAGLDKVNLVSILTRTNVRIPHFSPTSLLLFSGTALLLRCRVGQQGIHRTLALSRWSPLLGRLWAVGSCWAVRVGRSRATRLPPPLQATSLTAAEICSIITSWVQTTK